MITNTIRMFGFYGVTFTPNMKQCKNHMVVNIKRQWVSSIKNVPLVQVKTLSRLKAMVQFIEQTYSNQNKIEPSNTSFNNSSIGKIHITKEYENVYKCWNEFHFRPFSKCDPKRNLSEEKTRPHDIFSMCLDGNDKIGILKKNILGIYIPKHKSICSSKINYLYLFKHLKNRFNGKFIYEMYVILPNCVFLLSYGNLFTKIVYYEQICKNLRNSSENNIRKTLHNKLRRKVYIYKLKNLKTGIKGSLNILLGSTKYTKIIYEDAIELSSFLYNFLQIIPKHFIDLHHLYQKIISLYDLNLSRSDIYSVLPILFPNLEETVVQYDMEMDEDLEEETYKVLHKSERNRVQNRYNIVSFINNVKKDKNNLSRGNFGKTCNTKGNGYTRKEISVNEILNISSIYSKRVSFEKDIIYILYLFPCALKLLHKYKDAEGIATIHIMNGVIKKYNVLNNISKRYLKNIEEMKNKNRRTHLITERTENNDLFFNRFSYSLHNNHVDIEEVHYDHKLMIGTHVYAYLYEINKMHKSITFRFNANSPHVSFKNIISLKEVPLEDLLSRKRKMSFQRIIKKVTYQLYNQNRLLSSRNKFLFNYNNNMLIGYLHDKENNFDYFLDKQVGDIVLCTVQSISACGKFIYLQRYDTKNLIFHFKKEKYINLEKNIDYDDLLNMDDSQLQEIF